MKIRPVEAELLDADGQTDRHRTKLLVAFRKFANASTDFINLYCIIHRIFSNHNADDPLWGL